MVFWSTLEFLIISPSLEEKKFEPENIETICLEVKNGNSSWFNISAVYLSPNKTNPTEFIQDLSCYIESIYRLRHEILLLGDFNFDQLKPHPGFTDLCEQFCLT